MIRTFIAYEIAETQKDAIQEVIEKGQSAFPREIKWVEPENLHFTYLFLGDIYPADQNIVCEMLQKYAATMPVISIKDGKLRWNSVYQPKVAWIEYDIQSRDFLKFRKKMIYELTQELPYLALDTKEYRCHLTLGRVRKEYIENIDITKIGEIDQNLSKAEITFDNLTFYQSHLTTKGPIYTKIINIKLSGGN